MKTYPSVLLAANRDTSIPMALAALIALVVFLIDALTPLDIAIAVLYVVVVLLVASTNNRAVTVATTWGCVALTLLGFVMSHEGGYLNGAAARCLVSLVAIGTTSVLSLRNQAAATTLQEQIQLLNLAHDAIVVHDMNDRITFWNHGAEALYGWTAQQALGQSIHQLTQTSFRFRPKTSRKNCCVRIAGTASFSAFDATAAWSPFRPARRSGATRPAHLVQCSPRTTT